MIEATCTTCGNINRVPADDIDAGARFLTCMSCKSRVLIPGAPAPPMPRREGPAGEGPSPLRIPRAATSRPVTPRSGPGIDLERLTSEAMYPSSSSGADLPAPKGSLPPRPGVQPAREGTGITDLPAPKSRRATPLEAAGKPALSDLSRSDAAGVVDLPAPKPKAPLAKGAAPAGAGGASGMVSRPPPKALLDLPAPKARGIGELPPSSIGGLGDLPAPKRDHDSEARTLRREQISPGSFADLTLPRGFGDLPAPKSGPGPADIADLPAPRRPAPEGAERRPGAAPDKAGAKPGSSPAPPLPKSGGPPDLPAPRARTSPELPAPKSATPDLPTPRPAGRPELPAPKAAGATPEPPAPKGFFDDLPQPARTSPPEPPAPKGFFDDLPQPARTSPPELPAPKAPPELPAPKAPPELPAPKAPPAPPEPPAPKGFFDDLPGRPAGKPRPPAGKPRPPEPPAPKGFFDDLPGHRPAAEKPQPPEPPAPKGFFDDLPGRPTAGKPQPAEPPAPKGFFDDLPGPARAVARKPVMPPIADAPPAAPAPPAGPAPETLSAEALSEFALELAPELPPPQLDTSGDDPLEHLLRAPTRPPVSDEDSTLPARRTAKTIAAARRPTPPPIEPVSTLPAASAPAPVARPADDRSRRSEQRAEPTLQLPKLSPKSVPGLSSSALARRLPIVLIAASVLLGLAVGGFFLYYRHAQKAARRAEIQSQLTAARAALAAKTPGSWARAAAAAQQALALDPKNPAAIGLAAEALLADALTAGTSIGAPAAAAGAPAAAAGTAAATATGKAAAARALLATTLISGLSGPEIDRAQALSLATDKQPELTRLAQLAAAARADLTLALYLGWANALRGDPTAAAAAFTRALDAEPLRLLALLGRAHARLQLADRSGARADFDAVLALDKDHLAAQVGRAVALPSSQVQQQEAELSAILARKDLATAEPRAVLWAWLAAADAARRAGKLELARERYQKAQALALNDATAAAAVMTGKAELELAADKLDTAVEIIEKAVDLDPTHVGALLVSAELAIRQQRISAAISRLETLRTRRPPLALLEQARLGLLEGKLLEAQGQDLAAANAYVAAADRAGDADLAPALAGVAKLATLAEAAEASHQAARAAELRARTERLIARFAGRAKREPDLALALGRALLAANAPDRAEPWLRSAVKLAPKAPDARYQLARALALLGKTDDAIAELERARDQGGGPALEIELELARIYEAAGKRDDAAALYGMLLAAKAPTLQVRASAGRFYARYGELGKAAEQAERLLAQDPRSPAGLYLKAEGLLAAGKLEEAERMFREVVDADREPQHLEGLGRAAEARAAQTGDAKLADLALRSYIAAAAAAPSLLGALLGQGRIYVARRDAPRALPPLFAASRLAPKDPEISRLIGLAYKEAAEAALRPIAVQWLTHAQGLAPSAETAWHLGQLYSDLNATKAAVAALTTATKLGIGQERKTGTKLPWLTDALYRLGRLHMDSGNERGARSAWEKYVRHDPKPGAQLDEVRRELATTLQRD